MDHVTAYEKDHSWSYLDYFSHFYCAILKYAMNYHEREWLSVSVN